MLTPSFLSCANVSQSPLRPIPPSPDTPLDRPHYSRHPLLPVLSLPSAAFLPRRLSSSSYPLGVTHFPFVRHIIRHPWSLSLFASPRSTRRLMALPLTHCLHTISLLSLSFPPLSISPPRPPLSHIGISLLPTVLFPPSFLAPPSFSSSSRSHSTTASLS